ncbi:unnamed protein product [Pleuronectes platessa]|uniref:Uncharacterized protein n=1 Tax=Pleuronectes platessa TaxID=8262 RepID=A0A9N7YQQ6_PLEPL|nr:unnamed protein product [Pleuronectes platessa]
MLWWRTEVRHLVCRLDLRILGLRKKGGKTQENTSDAPVYNQGWRTVAEHLPPQLGPVRLSPVPTVQHSTGRDTTETPGGPRTECSASPRHYHLQMQPVVQRHGSLPLSKLHKNNRAQKRYHVTRDWMSETM